MSRYGDADYDDMSYELDEFLKNHRPSELLKLVRDAVEWWEEKTMNRMNDLISRQAAIDVFKRELTTGESNGKYVTTCCAIGYDGIKQILESIPSAQPEIIRCKDCKWWGVSEYNTLGIPLCKRFSGVRGESDFCSKAERSEE